MDHYYVADPAGDAEFGVPFPAPGARVVFDIARFESARARDALPVTYRAPGPPGLVVFDDPRDAQSWPCRLWRVGDVRDAARPMPGLSYARCASFVVREELPAWLVFGVHGQAVAAVVELAGALTGRQAAELAALDSDAERRTHSAVFRRWLARDDAGGGKGPGNSPVGYGLGAVRDAVDAAAYRADPETFGWVDDAVDTPVLADPAWRSARDAARAAALAVGAPDVVHSGEYPILVRRWSTVVGPVDRA